MMKARTKWLSVLLALCLLVSGILAITVLAENTTVAAEAEKDGIQVSLKTSDKNFSKTGEISVVLEVANDSDSRLTNVSSVITAPADLIIKSGQLTQDWESMSYHALAQNTINVTTLTAAANAGNSENSGNSEDSGNSGNTGTEANKTPLWVWLVVLLAVLAIVGVLIFLVVTGRIKLNKSACLLLLASVLLVSLTPTVNAAEEGANTLTVEKEVAVGDETFTVSATVTWEYEAPKPAASTLTRADLEAALAEIAWDWYFKGTAYQYDSSALNALTQHLNDPLCGYCGGKSRLSANATMEDATSDSAVFTVCSGFCYDVYNEALGYPIFGSKFNSLTMTLWRNSSYPDDMAILRWHTKGKDADGNVIKYNGYDTTYNIDYSCWYDTDEVYEFFKNYETTMRAGDIIVFDNPGHAMLYVGNGIVLDANGKKYSMDTGTDGWEDDGTVDYSTIESKFFDPDNKNFDVGALGWCENSIVIVRPLNILTIDDGDGDPSNDLLDPNYELDTGLLKYQLASDTTTQVKTSGYDITDTTYTRMEYPGIEIDRTSSITPYGTAAQGSTITYTVSVTNNSDNAYYIDYRARGGDEDYEGEDYEDLWVVEYIPENTELYSALGAMVDGNTLRWNMKIPAGETRNFAYTVKVTGEIGEQIVSGGGWVANIPSNTITNTIGGQKLSSSVQAAMTRFFEDGRDVWNSNDGYKISAATDEGTHFAERIYQETAGLDLQLPDVQQIMDIFFSETKVYEPYGYYLYHDSNGITRYMYSLNEKAANEADQIYYDMLVPGYYGGLWCYTDERNCEARINELRVDYLEVGDILIYMDLTESESDGEESEKRVVEDWTVLVYLGNDCYASLNSLGRLDPVNSAFGRTAAFSHDLFVCLRPSQVYEDLSTDIPAYTGTAPDLTEKDKRQVYVPNPSNILLNEAGCKLFAELSISDYEWIKVNGVFIGEVYSKIGMDIVTNGTDDASFATLLKNLFEDVEDDSEAYRTFGHHYFAVTEPKYGAEKQYEMLLYYGGDAFADEKPISSMDDLHPGDVVMLGSRTSRFYVTTIYQGDGNFLLNVQSLALTGIESKIWGELHFDSNAEFMAWLDSNIAPFAETLDTRGRFNPDNPNVSSLRYEGYLVLRPSRAFENINQMVKRDIKDSPLTDDEKKALAALTPEDWKDGGKKYNLGASSTWIYGSAGINTSKYLGSNSIYAARNLLFKYVGNKMTLMNSTDAGYDLNYRIMLVPDAYGGTAFDTTNTFTADEFQIGDLFCGAKSKALNGGNSTLYCVAVYQGNGKFLVIENGGPEGTRCYVDSTFVFSANINAEWSYYYVLRPDRLATISSIEEATPIYPDTPSDPSLRFIDKHKLATWEMDAIANLTFDDWSENCDSLQIKAILPWAYKEAGIDITMLKHGYTALTYAGIDSALNADDPYYTKILLAGTHGSGAFDLSSVTLQIGDMFGGRVVVKKADGVTNVNLYYGAIYQGNGNWMAFWDTYDVATDTKSYDKGICTTADFQGKAWDFRYVLRPDQLATDPAPAEPEESSVRDIADRLLNEDEKNALAALTPADWEAGGQAYNLGASSTWIYGTANIATSEYLGSNSIYAARNLLFAYSGGKLVPMTSADSAYDANYAAMLVENSWGGTEYASSNILSADMLQIGDLFCGAQSKSVHGGTGTRYMVALYQGNGQFLVIENGGPNGTCAYTDSTLLFSETLATEWAYYYVLRPENLAVKSDSGEETPVEPEEDAIRDISKHKLTTTEKAVLSNLVKEDLTISTVHMHGIMPEFYSHANITVEGHSKHAGNVFSLLFAKPEGSDYYAPKASVTDEIAQYFHPMLIGCYGGNLIEQSSWGMLADASLQVGDIFAGRIPYSAGNRYWCGLYQGDGKFLMCYSTESNVFTIEHMTVTDLDAAITNDTYNFDFYYILRPENLAETEAPTVYAVTWKNADGTTLETDLNVLPGAVPTYDGETPTKTADAQYTYTFSGWTPTVAAATADVTYTATYMQSANTYTVTWKNGDTVLEVDENVAYGTVPTYDGETPTKTGNAQYSYTFSGWTPTVESVAGDVTYTAAFTETVNTYTVTWKNGDTVLETDENVPYGTVPTYDGETPTIASDGATVYSFIGWTPTVEAVTGNATYTALFSDTPVTYTVTWKNGDTVLETDENVAYGAVPTYDGETPTKAADAQYTYTFSGWTPTVAAATADVTYTATFTETINTYTVTWKDADGTTVLETDENVPYGTNPAFNGVFSEFKYLFAGWTPTVEAVTGDVTYTASYSNTALRSFSSGKLTDAELSIIASLTVKDLDDFKDTSRQLSAILPWVYKEAGIDVSDHDDFKSFLTFASAKNAAITETNESYAYYSAMLVDNSYQTSVQGIGIDVSKLQIGDIICGCRTDTQASNASNANYYSGAIYQGSGKFLALYDWYVSDTESDNYNKKIGVAAVVDVFYFSSYEWTYSYVLRPEQLAGATRDISLRHLTEAEKSTLSALDITGTLAGGVDLNSILPKTYSAIGIDTTDWVTGTGNSVRKALFGGNISSGAALTDDGSDLYAFYSQILVDGFYGGNVFANGTPGSKEIATENLQVGDILCAMISKNKAVGTYTFGGKNSYLVLVYQGNGRFDGAINYSKQGDSSDTATTRDWNGATIEQLQTIDAADGFNYYYVLRPDMLAD